MKIWIGVTDKSWFGHRTHLEFDQAKFWQPSVSRGLKVLRRRESLLFKFHNPESIAVG